MVQSTSNILLEMTPRADNISPSWIGQFGATINSIPQPTSVGLSGAGIVDSVKYEDNMPR